MGGSKLAEPRSRPLVDSKVFEICELLSRAGGVDFHPIPADPKAKSGLPGIGHGWVIEGAEDPKQLRAAADLVSRLASAEAEIASLSGEIVDRYEEATLLYRLSQRLATVEGEPSITRLVVDEAATSLAVRAAELWLRVDDEVRLVAAVPESSLQSSHLREHGPLAALDEGRPWIRNASASHEAVVAVPLPGPENRTLGVLVLRGGEAERSFGAGNVKLITALAALASAFLRNSRLVQIRKQPGTDGILGQAETIRRTP